MGKPPRPGAGAIRPVSNPPHRWQATWVEWCEEPPPAGLHVFEDRSRTILSRNDSPDVPFTWSVNPYRGCFHACAYCYARPSHEYLDLGAGTDFERRLVVKPEAAALLREAFDRRSWRGETVVFSGNTDCYQPLEAAWGLTRGCLEVCLAYRNPVGVITKSALIERDLGLLVALAEHDACHVTVSVPFFDPEVARAMEPGVPTPQRRLRTIRRLAEAGVPVGINIAPIIPGLSDSDIAPLMEAAAEAGASWVGTIMVRLPGPVATVFEARLREHLPLRADRVLAQIAACRAGRRSDARFGHRMRGTGERWQAIATMIEVMARRHGLAHPPRPREATPFQRPPKGGQLALL